MNNQPLTAEEGQKILSVLGQMSNQLDRMEEGLEGVVARLERVETRLNTIEGDIREIKSDISRIDGNIEIMATSQGYPYNKEKRIVTAFERTVS